jgi:hypothetical protein
MEYYPVYDEAILKSGPLFGDEIGWSGGINKQIADKYNLARRGIRFRGGAGVYTIYTPSPKLEAALIRYLHRYRSLVEVILRRGLSGERMLLQQGWYEDELDYLFEQLPEHDNDFSPVVYELLWKSITYEEYLSIIEVLNRRERFSPVAIAEAVGLKDGGRGFFKTFVRRNLVMSADRRQSEQREYTTRSGSDSIRLEPHTDYFLTEYGSDAVAGVIAEHQRLFEGDAKPKLDLDIERATAHIPPRSEVKQSEDSEVQVEAELDIPEADELTELADQLEAQLNE